MAIVVCVDCGGVSAGEAPLESDKGWLGLASAGDALHRKRENPCFATQSHEERVTALAAATCKVPGKTGVKVALRNVQPELRQIGAEARG